MVNAEHWSWIRHVSEPNHEKPVLPRGEICWAPNRRFRRRIAALESRTPFEVGHLIRRSATGWVAETGLERPAYPQMPLRGNENLQTPETGILACLELLQRRA